MKWSSHVRLGNKGLIRLKATDVGDSKTPPPKCVGHHSCLTLPALPISFKWNQVLIKSLPLWVYAQSPMITSFFHIYRSKVGGGEKRRCFHRENKKQPPYQQLLLQQSKERRSEVQVIVPDAVLFILRVLLCKSDWDSFCTPGYTAKSKVGEFCLHDFSKKHRWTLLMGKSEYFSIAPM